MKKGGIQNLIYPIRGKQVMLDSDVASLYQYDTKRINEVVKRNKNRFPDDFYFQLDTDEIKQILRSQTAISYPINKGSSRSHSATLNYGGRGKNVKYLPYVFTEQGIAMLSGMLKNDVAVQVSINIMNAFVQMRKFISDNAPVLEQLTEVRYHLLEHDKKFDIVFDKLQSNNKPLQGLFFEGQIYDAYELLIKIIKSAKKSIVIIDNYIDDKILLALKAKAKAATIEIITSNEARLTPTDIDKFNQQYPRVELTKSKSFHDRFIIIDNKQVFHFGSSLKDIGRKCFAINEISDTSIKKQLFVKIKSGEKP